jgi:HEAT repeat protein
MRINIRYGIIIACALLVLWGPACWRNQTESPNGGIQAPDLPNDVDSLIELLGQPQQPNENEIMRRIADHGLDAVPALIDALGEGGETETGAAHVLAMIGQPAVPELIDALRSDNYPTRYGAITALQEIGPDASGAVDALKGHFTRATMNEQISIMYALRDISPTPDVVAMLSAALRVQDLQWPAMRVMGDMGSVSEPAIPTLLGYLNDENSQTRIETMLSLEGIGKAEGVVSPIAGVLSDEDPRVRTQAATTLGTFGTAAGSATDELAAALNDENEEVRRAAAKSLGQIAPASSGAINALARALHDESPQVRRQAAWALGQFGSDASSALGALRDAAENDEYDYVRNEASNAIESIEGSQE